jgi:hypothetical protein
MIVFVLYIGPVEIHGADDHEGYVSGVSPDGGRSDIWTDARRLPGPTAYAPACECGWHGTPVHPAGPDGYRAAQRSWVEEHFARLAETRPALDALGRSLCPDSDFLSG